MTSGAIRVLGQKSLIPFEDVLISLESHLVVFVDLRSCDVSLLGELTDPIDLLAHKAFANLLLSVRLVKDVEVSWLYTHHWWLLLGFGLPYDLSLEIPSVLLRTLNDSLLVHNGSKGVLSVSLNLPSIPVLHILLFRLEVKIHADPCWMILGGGYSINTVFSLLLSQHFIDQLDLSVPDVAFPISCLIVALLVLL